MHDERGPVNRITASRATFEAIGLRALMASALLTSVLLCASAVHAQDTVVRLEPADAMIDFTLGATLHTVHGAFKMKSGEIHVDPATGKASGSIIVDATSGDSGDSGRDHNMHTNVLESAKYPEIVFSPSMITAASGHSLKDFLSTRGTVQLQAAGIFRLHGANHDMTLDLAVENDGAGHLQISTKFPIPYVKWGLKSPNTFFLRVTDSVDLEIHTSGRIVPNQMH